MLHPLTALLGAAVGLSLGMVGGGGALALPLLRYGVGLSPREAVAVSLASTCVVASYGAVARLRSGDVDARTTAIFVATGFAGAPAGAWLGSLLPETALLVSFAGLMLLVAGSMWRRRDANAEEARALEPARRGPVCRHDADGRVRWTSRCALALGAAGVATGVLSGLFGVGGGFLIVPALVFFGGFDAYRAASTSLPVVALVSLSGLASLGATGISLPPATAAWFALGGLLGMKVGTKLARRLPGSLLRRTFAVVLVGVAILVIVRETS